MRATANITNPFVAALAKNRDDIIICIKTSELFVVEPHSSLPFDDITTAKIISVSNLVTKQASNITNSAAVAAATIAATLPLKSNYQKLPLDVCN